MRQIVLAAWMLLLSGVVYAYPAKWTEFDRSALDGVRDKTIGNTQEMLRERGSFECIVCHGETDDHYDGVITTVDIIEATADATLSCMQWEVTGICVWLKCAIPPACSISTTIKVKNHVPELVVQSYDRANGEPWTESQDINQISQGDADSSWVSALISVVESFDVDSVGIRGGTQTQAYRYQHANLDFKLVDAYGNPGLPAFNQLANSTNTLICEGQATPMYPYFISNLDSIAWRWDIPEMFLPPSWIPLTTTWDLGDLSNNYGPIYPRHGFTVSQDPLKTAVLTAFRAAHVITRPMEPHLYFSIDTEDEDGYWPSEPLDKNDPATGMWQMMYPESQSECQSFPYSATPAQSLRSEDDSYVWGFWKSYQCCDRDGQILLFHTEQ